jgi:hypothetical protein
MDTKTMSQQSLEDRARETARILLNAGENIDRISFSREGWRMVHDRVTDFVAATERAAEAARGEVERLKREASELREIIDVYRSVKNGDIARLRERLAVGERLLRDVDRDEHVVGLGYEWWGRLDAFLATLAAPVTPAEPRVTPASYSRESGALLTRIEPGHVIETRAHGELDGYLTIVEWEQRGGGSMRVLWEMSPAAMERLREVLGPAPVTPKGEPPCQWCGKVTAPGATHWCKGAPVEVAPPAERAFAHGPIANYCDACGEHIDDHLRADLACPEAPPSKPQSEAPPAPWSWPPKKGDRAQWGTFDAGVFTFTGEPYRYTDGYAVSQNGVVTGFLRESDFTDGNWIRLPPEAAPPAPAAEQASPTSLVFVKPTAPCRWCNDGADHAKHDDGSPAWRSASAAPTFDQLVEKVGPLPTTGLASAAPTEEPPRDPTYDSLCVGEGREASLAVARWLARKATGKVLDQMSDWGQDRYIEEARALLRRSTPPSGSSPGSEAPFDTWWDSPEAVGHDYRDLARRAYNRGLADRGAATYSEERYRVMFGKHMLQCAADRGAAVSRARLEALAEVVAFLDRLWPTPSEGQGWSITERVKHMSERDLLTKATDMLRARLSATTESQ